VKLKYFIASLVLFLLCGIANADSIPSLVGKWSGHGRQVSYENVNNLNEVPVFFDVNLTLDVLSQKGMVFAGYLNAGKDKITGAIVRGVNNTYEFKIQSYGDNSRNFISGQLIVKGKTKKIIGIFHSFEEISLANMPSIGTGSFVLTKNK
jgi:hypothetical protein